MRQQVPTTEDALGTTAKKATLKACKRDDTVGNGRRNSGDCLSFGEGKVFLKMPGNRLKGGCSTHHNKQDDRENKVSDITEEHIKKEEEIVNDDKKRPFLEGEGLLQWGQRKRLRFGRLDVKSVVEESAGLKKTIRVDRRVVRADKQVQPAVQSRRPAVLACAPSIPKLASGDSRRDSEGAPLGLTIRNGNHCHSSDGFDVEASACQRADMQPQALLANPDKASDFPATTIGGGATAGNGQTEIEGYQERASVLEKVDMDLFDWPKFIIPLSRKEKEDDFLAIKGSKLPQRPKKRSKQIEKLLQTICPGTWLCDLNRDRYEVRGEKKAVKKKPRGLKAMGSVDSDSE